MEHTHTHTKVASGHVSALTSADVTQKIGFSYNSTDMKMLKRERARASARKREREIRTSVFL